jgi:N-acylneuraminate cytidylyltransferase
MKEEAIAIITARGGSKRIPQKNIRSFCGKPILAYSIEAAKASGLFSEVMVSTDSEEIAEIARQYGAVVPFMRSAKTSDDYATTADVLLEVMEKYQEMGRTFSYICCIYPTAPFVTAEKLTAALQLMREESQTKVVMPVVAFSYPPQRCFVVDAQGLMQYKYPEYQSARSQDLEKQYHDAGQFYVYRADNYLECRGKIVDGIKAIIVPEPEAQDIDNEDDWEIAELKYQLMQRRDLHGRENRNTR